jgi:hypothetical protein
MSRQRRTSCFIEDIARLTAHELEATIKAVSEDIVRLR